MTKNGARAERFKKLGATLSPLDQLWAERRGEAVTHEYRGAPSGYSGPTTLQLGELRTRRSAKLKIESPEEAAQRDAEGRLRVEAILAAHGIV